MGELVKIAAMAVIAAVLISVLNQYSKTYAVVATVAVCCLFLLYSARMLSPLLDTLARLSDTYSSADFGCVVKAVGIAIVTQGAADICADAGQSAVAGRVVLAGKVAIVAVTLPLFQSLIELLVELLR